MRSASLRVQGFLQRAHWTGNSSPQIQLDASERLCNAYPNATNDVTDVSGDSGRVWCLKVGKYTHSGSEREPGDFAGLLLVSVGLETYQRVGVFLSVKEELFVGCEVVEITLV